MNHIFGIFLIVLATLALGCSSVKRAPDNRVSIIGSGTMILQQAILAHSDRPEVGFAFDVTVRQGDDFSVITSVDDNLADYLVLGTEGRTLHIGLRPSFAYDIPAATMRAEVVMPRLAGGAGNEPVESRDAHGP